MNIIKVTLVKELAKGNLTVGTTYPVKHITNSMNRDSFLEYIVDDKGTKLFFGFTNPLDKEDKEINKHFKFTRG